ncbi:MAG: AmmeMemoRadiSam system protein B [Candidatus Latescibacteria bacterium]|nr:AmmeMemoRadiSam system protein B [Candidatus Latescibacterota bacterium]NIM20925.1 AmmeMemoRadiSam system protein B [Candidatus Latescibacterota bacterium]NIM65060.1 AmmeMemoRadiSam system protein B [Candidatus Latescibacterota bacterium]NIO01575.1 AmmeMemoRadiSam system protein B [Candidatus Latescibacterota bacterium]NIO28092.1 AmmeMemoRadiSam system protein B [Candidatus Latescibacterota bacterium]
MEHYNSIRKPVVAGTFYPGRPADLKTQITDLLERAEDSLPKIDIRGRIFGLVVPHAGYIYSGQVAAHGYRLIRNSDIDTVIVVSPSHMELFPFASIFSGDAYETPLGTIAVDKDLAEKIASMNPLVKLSEKGHIQNHLPHREHALEVQLPFLQSVLKGFKIVPIVMGDQSWKICEALGDSLSSFITPPEVLVVASSDLSHFHSYEEAERLDKTFCALLEEMDPEAIFQAIHRSECEACGAGPVIAALIAGLRAGASQCQVLSSANSGDVSGDRSNVVGYTAAAIIGEEHPNTRKAGKKAEEPFRLTPEERRHLLAMARHVIQGDLGMPVGEFVPLPSPALDSKQGAFVTIRSQGQLRGCIGYIEAVKPLRDVVAEMARAAAFRDPRFPSLEEGELPSITIEISVLSPLSRIEGPAKIEIGRHGLVVEKGFNKGLLLPQVAVEYDWEIEEFLEHTCEKAALAPDAWKDPDTRIYAFSAVIFGEDEPPSG